jgi:hypothetical protein
MASSNSRDIYLEPVVEVDSEILDPLYQAAADDVKVIVAQNVCSPGGC